MSDTTPERENGGIRLSIGIKIFSIAAGLLVLMAVVALFSFLRISRVNREVSSIARYQMPLKDHISAIATQALQQEIHLGSVRRLYASGEPDADAVGREMAQFEALGKQVDEEVADAIGLAKTDLDQAVSNTDALEFAEVIPMLKTVETAHKQFHDHVLKVVDALARGETARADGLLEALPDEKEGLNREVEEVLRQLNSYTDASTQEAAAHERRVLQLNAVLTLVAVALGLLSAFLVTIGLLRPVRQLVAGTQAVEGGNLDVTVPVTSRDEVGVLARSFNRMTGELRLKKRIKETFGKYIDPRVVEDLIQHPEAMAVQGEQRVMTVLFSDIESFTPIGEKLTPEALVSLLNHYLTMASGPIKASNGVIDKYVGDEVMAFWGPPFTRDGEHALAACETALATFEHLALFREALPGLMGLRDGAPNINIRIGIATGEVVVGNIGSDVSKSYTVIGDTVNLASRLEGASKQYGTRLLISEGTRQMVGDAVETRELDTIQVVGKNEPVRVFELLSRRGQLDDARASARDRFEAGLAAYRAQDWTQATSDFEACLAVRAEDGPAKVFLERVSLLRMNPPGDSWKGVWRLDHK